MDLVVQRNRSSAAGFFLRVSNAYSNSLFMNATIYGRGQMVIPAKARKEARIGTGDVVSVEPEGDGRILLVRLERPKEPAPAKSRIVHRKGRHPVGDLGRAITREEITAALADFP
jgi:AbrB family looped-hinge helix DNA binding protein